MSEKHSRSFQVAKIFNKTCISFYWLERGDPDDKGLQSLYLDDGWCMHSPSIEKALEWLSVGKRSFTLGQNTLMISFNIDEAYPSLCAVFDMIVEADNPIQALLSHDVVDAGREARTTIHDVGKGYK